MQVHHWSSDLLCPLANKGREAGWQYVNIGLGDGEEAWGKRPAAAETAKEIGAEKKANELAIEGLKALKNRYVARWSGDGREGDTDIMVGLV